MVMNKIRIVLDTNTLISGTFWLGIPSHIIKLIEKEELILIISSAIVEEYDNVLNYDEIREKVKHHNECVQAIQKLLQLGIIVDPKEKFVVIKEDPDDDKLLEAAIAGNAQYIISKDKHLLNLKEWRGIHILKPEDFLERLEDIGLMILSEESLKESWSSPEDDVWDK